MKDAKIATMGQAKQRGTYEERKDLAEFYESEQKRLDDWLYARRKRRIYNCDISEGMKWAAAAFAISASACGRY